VYERRYGDKNGDAVGPGGKATQVLDDTRLHGDEHDEHHFYFEAPPEEGASWKISAKLTWTLGAEQVVMERASSTAVR
jgi:hypothetical protein